jgi:hypothetical protein
MRVGARWCVRGNAEMPKNVGEVKKTSSKGHQGRTVSREKTSGASSAADAPLRGNLDLGCLSATWALVMNACAMRS